MSADVRRILALDGGGSKGAFTASTLAVLEKSLGRPVFQVFDLVAGTSTGGLICLCLASGMSAPRVQEFYSEICPLLFKKKRSWFGLSQPMYDPEPLRVAVTREFGSRTLGDLSGRVMIPSCEAETGRVHIFKTPYDENFTRDRSERLTTVAMATSAAPLYFPEFRHEGATYVDGGIWANNPAIAAGLEATERLGWSRERVRLLSIGCTGSTPTPPQLGPIGWHSPRRLRQRMMNLVESVFVIQSHAATSMAEVLLGKGRVLRVAPQVSAGRFALDDPCSHEELAALGHSETHRQLTAIRAFLEV